jgi:hypothetical protein
MKNTTTDNPKTITFWNLKLLIDMVNLKMDYVDQVSPNIKLCNWDFSVFHLQNTFLFAKVIIKSPNYTYLDY